MTITVSDAWAKGLAIFLLGFALGLGFGVAPQHAHWPQPQPKPVPTPPAPPEPAPKPKPPFPSSWRSDPMDFDHAHLCGWIPDGGHLPIAATMPALAQAGPGLVADPSRSVLLYKVWREVFASDPDYPAQQIGDCVSFGHGHANDLLETIGVYLGDLPIDAVHQTDTEWIYGMSRKVAGILGRQDGSYGSAAVKAMTTVGMVSRAALGENGAYSGSRAKEWGLTGPPIELDSVAAGYKLGAAARVTDTDGAIAALQAGHPFTICTSLGFAVTRDADGFCKRHGRWGHCMFVSAYRADRPGFCVMQSWGPDQPQGPTALDQPSWSFWITPEDLQAVLDEGDCWALSGSPGFAPRSLPSELLKA